ncbi:MAG: hypothetical protein ACO1RX_12175 [Candidatus Sericytochromatia bacterium]
MKRRLLLSLLSLSLWACQSPESRAVPGVPAAPATPTPRPSASVLPSASPRASSMPVPSPTPRATAQPSPVGVSQTPQIAARYVGQLFYQLDCLAGQPNCSREAYAALWQSLGYSRSDLPQLQAWQSLKAQYNVTRPGGTSLNNLAEPLVFQGSSVWQTIRAHSLQSDSLEAFEQRLADTLTAPERRALVALLQHFSDKFMQDWWRRSGQAAAEQLVKDYRSAFASYQLNALIEDVSRFYGGPAQPLNTLQFHLLLQAPGAEDLSLAEQILNHGLIEVSPQQSPQSQLDVMIHEMTHYLFKQLSPERQAAIQAFFARQPEAGAMSAYHLLDESLATAIGNGRVNERVLSPAFFAQMRSQERAFYNDAFIDLNGKAQFEARTTEQGHAIDSEAFLKAYYRTVRETLNLDHPVPSLRLSAVYLAQDSLKAAMPEFQARLKPWSQFVIAGGNAGPDFFARYARLNGVLWFDAGLTGLEAWRSLLGEAALTALQQQRQRPFVYGVSTPLRQIYVFSSASAEEHTQLMRLLFSQPSHFSGFRFP